MTGAELRSRMSGGWGAAASWAAILAVILVVAWGLRRYFALHLDLRDFPGPASGHILTRAGPAAIDGPGVDAHLSREALLLGGPMLPAMRQVMMIWGLMGVAGAALGGAAVAGRLGALAAGFMAAAWSQSLMLALMVSYDTVGYGASWLGLGLALAACRWGGEAPPPWARSPDAAPQGAPPPAAAGRLVLGVGRELAWLAALTLGCMLVVYGLGAKEVAHPLLPMLAAAPFFIRRGWWRWGAAAAVVGTIGVWGLSWQLKLGLVDPNSPRHVRRLPDLDPMAVPRGLARCWDLLQVGPGLQFNIMLAVTGVALLGALIPGRAWLGRLALLAVSAVALGLSWDLVGDWLRLRYLAVPSLPILLLAAGAVAAAGRLLRFFPLTLVPALLVAGLFTADALDFGRQWSKLREPFTEIEASTLPIPPAWPWHQNDHLVGNAFGDYTLTGGISMLELVAQGPPGGVATIPIRDGRDSHITAAAVLEGKPYTVLDSPSCCQDDRATIDCALQVVDAIDAAGGMMLLPRMVQGDPRLTMPALEGWRGVLKDAARARGELVPASRFWWSYIGKGSGGSLPCNPGTAASPPPRRPQTRLPPPPDGQRGPLPVPPGGPDPADP